MVCSGESQGLSRLGSTVIGSCYLEGGFGVSLGLLGDSSIPLGLQKALISCFFFGSRTFPQLVIEISLNYQLLCFISEGGLEDGSFLGSLKRARRPF